MRSRDQRSLSRILRELILEATDQELRDAANDAVVDYQGLVARARAAARSAIEEAELHSRQDLHKGLGTLVLMLRRKERLSLEELATRARIDARELQQIEGDLAFEPNPRTVYQLERFFRLPERSLVLLSGAVRVDPAVRDEALRFAASAKGIKDLTREEMKLLHRFVRFLKDHTDR